MKTNRLFKVMTIAFMLSTFLVFSSAATNSNKETERIRKASSVLREFGKMKESIPHSLIAEYSGIVIIPRMINAGFGIGGKIGHGVALVKLGNGKWSDPVFITLAGGSIGAQIGVQSVDLVLVFRHKGMLTKVRNGDVTIGGDISAAAGPVGRSTSANTDYKLQAEVYSYSRSRGLFAGISINGTSLSIDKKADGKYYGPDASSMELFETSKSGTTDIKMLKGSLAAL